MEPMWAIILNIWKDEPVYHRWADWAIREQTVCGRKIDEDKPWLPMKHAKKFGRPCKGCFP